MHLAARCPRQPSQMVTVAYIWHFQENQNLLSPFRLIWRTLDFCVLAQWAMAGCWMWTTAVLAYCAFQARQSCRNRAMRGRPEQNKRTAGATCAFRRGQPREWSGFSQKCGAVVFGCWCTRRFKNNPSCGGGSSRSQKLGPRWERRGRGGGRKEMREKQEGDNFTEQRGRREIKKKKRKKRGRGFEG